MSVTFAGMIGYDGWFEDDHVRRWVIVVQLLHGLSHCLWIVI